MKLPNESTEKDAEKDKAEKQPNDKDSPSDDDKLSEGMYLSVLLKEINIFEWVLMWQLNAQIDDLI